MKLTIPTPLRQKHEALYDELRRAKQAGAEVGEAAKALALQRGDQRAAA